MLLVSSRKIQNETHAYFMKIKWELEYAGMLHLFLSRGSFYSCEEMTFKSCSMWTYHWRESKISIMLMGFCQQDARDFELTNFPGWTILLRRLRAWGNNSQIIPVPISVVLTKAFLLWGDGLEQLYKYLPLLMPDMMENIVSLRCKHLRLPAIFWWYLVKRTYTTEENCSKFEYCN